MQTQPSNEAGTGSNHSALECPECAAEIAITRAPLIGEIIRCGDCAMELEVTCTSPIAVEAAPQVEEDWGE